MITKHDAREQIAEIHRMLEQSTRYTNISPWSAFSAGITGLIAAALSQWLAGEPELYPENLPTLVALWSVCFVLSALLAALFSAVKARHQNDRLWITPLKRALFNFGVLALVGAVLTAALLRYRLYFMIPAVWMLCYGAGMSVGGVFSLRAFRDLGLFFVACGTVAVFFPAINHWLLMLSFGLGHIALGLVIRRTLTESPPAP